MNEYIINVTRDSVCMGDDVDAPHSYKFKISENATFNEIFEHLAKKRYLASVAGKNHSWEAIVNNKSLALFKGNNQQPEPSKTLTKTISTYTIKNTLNVRFKYNSATT